MMNAMDSCTNARLRAEPSELLTECLRDFGPTQERLEILRHSVFVLHVRQYSPASLRDG